MDFINFVGLVCFGNWFGIIPGFIAWMVFMLICKVAYVLITTSDSASSAPDSAHQLNTNSKT